MKLSLRSFQSRFTLHPSIVLGLILNTALVAFTPLAPGIAAPTPDLHQEKISSAIVPHLRVVVNSNQDGSVQPDAKLTLREAIQIVNGTLPLNQLSEAEKAQVQSLSSETPSQIAFNLPQSATTIHLVDLLPSLASPGLMIDGTTQPGYDSTQSATDEIAIPTPIVAITPAEQAEVFRGLTVVADRVTIRGLSVYGFTAKHHATETIPPADIFIAAPHQGVEPAQLAKNLATKAVVPDSPATFNRYIWPTQGVLTSRFGPRHGRMHQGIDIAGSMGTPVLAAADGVVVAAGWTSGGYGNVIDVLHTDGSFTRYGHNRRILVSKGQQVQQGEQIAEIGNTGRSTGPHLHFEVHPSGDKAANPLNYLAPSSDQVLARGQKPQPSTFSVSLNVNSQQETSNLPPQNVVIEDNWIGIRADGSTPSKTSAFGVSVFNSVGTTIRRNRIANHDGSAVITGVQAKNLQVSENIIVGNGIAGMPDAIRLEGQIDRAQIASNLIRSNDGSAVFLFKPQGSVVIRNNQIESNGRRLRRAAIYLMGNDHQVLENTISHQSGPGVVVASYPKSNRNIIQGNRFSAIKGLSIDLNTQNNVEAKNYQIGDGPNPPRNSSNRRLETGNAAIDAPQFLSPEFLLRNGRVNLDGTADPGSIVEIYRVTEDGNLYGPLSEPLAKVTSNEKGRFDLTLTNLQPGDRVSAIATDPKYGTSEPAQNAVVRSLN